jgi:RNA polymerase-binding transcription factor DksA
MTDPRPASGESPEWPPMGDERKRELAHFQRRLLEERRRLLRLLGRSAEQFGASSTAADGDLTNYPFHIADQGTDTIEQETGFLIASQESRILWHVDDALRRLYREPERFGVCEHCGAQIGFERLDAIPHTRFCRACKSHEVEP